MLELLVHEATGVKAVSMHDDISAATSEEVVIFSLADAPRFELFPDRRTIFIPEEDGRQATNRKTNTDLHYPVPNSIMLAKWGLCQTGSGSIG